MYQPAVSSLVPRKPKVSTIKELSTGKRTEMTRFQNFLPRRAQRSHWRRAIRGFRIIVIGRGGVHTEGQGLYRHAVV